VDGLEKAASAFICKKRGTDLMKLDFGRKVIGQIFAPDFQTNFHPKTEANPTYNIFNASDATEWSGLQSGRKSIFIFQMH
jgi:hypothetical protein